MEKKKQSVSLALKFPALLGLSFKEKGSTGASEVKIWGSRAELPQGRMLSWQGSSGDWDLPLLSDIYRKCCISNSNSLCLSIECELHIKNDLNKHLIAGLYSLPLLHFIKYLFLDKKDGKGLASDLPVIVLIFRGKNA